VVDWELIENHWPDLLRTAITIRENRLSSVTLLRRLGNHSRKNRLYRAFRELGRAIRTITLLRYLSEPELREQITQVTNRNEAFHGFADWLMFGGKLIGHNDPDHQEKVVKFNELIANCVIYSTACDITDAANDIAAEGQPVDTDDLATVSPYITHTVRRFGNWTLNLTPPDQTPATPARPRTPRAVRSHDHLIRLVDRRGGAGRERKAARWHRRPLGYRQKSYLHSDETTPEQASSGVFVVTEASLL
jgi:hypothetical protein